MEGNISCIKNEIVTGNGSTKDNINKTCESMKSAALVTSDMKAIYRSKPKLKVWTHEIKVAIKDTKSKYKSGKKKENLLTLLIIICKRKREPKSI